MMADNDIVVGIYYELPNGHIVYTYGFDDVSKTVTYRFANDEFSHLASYSELASWKPRPDLKDFPNADDPRLPYVFDLNWDLKRVSDLKRALNSRHHDIAAIKQAMRKYKINL